MLLFIADYDGNFIIRLTEITKGEKHSLLPLEKPLYCFVKTKIYF